MSGIQQPYPWFALHVSPGREKFVAAHLRSRGYTEFLPLYRTRRAWSDRIKELHLALFPGYLFCRFDPDNRLPVLSTPRVHLIVGVGKTPVPVDESEIRAVQLICNSGLGPSPWPYLQMGQRVRIEDGPLFGVEGILLAVKNSHRLVVSVTLLQRSVAVEIDQRWARPVGPLLRRPEAGQPFLWAGA